MLLLKDTKIHFLLPVALQHLDLFGMDRRQFFDHRFDGEPLDDDRYHDDHVSDHQEQLPVHVGGKAECQGDGNASPQPSPGHDQVGSRHKIQAPGEDLDRQPEAFPR